ncbi:ATP-binding cassette domain-containing protein [Sphingomonas sp.]|uniref:ATP-binding cassette domain-containing protein n=1 Tax=Sphingomonas sp. TaxID=28214 RepID=UPI003F7255C7
MTEALGSTTLSVIRDGVLAVHDISLSIVSGSWFGLIGANGSGKTSYLRAVAGRLELQGGTVRIDGADRTADRTGRAAAIGYAPDAAMLPGALTGRAALGIVAGDSDRALSAIGDIAAALALAPLLDRRIGACSAGQRQRIAIACAFAAGQGIVILDEPFNWLDPVAAYDLRHALAARVADGLTLVTALHDLATLSSACHAGALLTEGCVALELDAAALASARSDPAAFEARTIAHLRGQAAKVSVST